MSFAFPGQQAVVPPKRLADDDDLIIVSSNPVKKRRTSQKHSDPPTAQSQVQRLPVQPHPHPQPQQPQLQQQQQHVPAIHRPVAPGVAMQRGPQQPTNTARSHSEMPPQPVVMAAGSRDVVNRNVSLPVLDNFSFPQSFPPGNRPPRYSMAVSPKQIPQALAPPPPPPPPAQPTFFTNHPTQVPQLGAPAIFNQQPMNLVAQSRTQAPLGTGLQQRPFGLNQLPRAGFNGAVSMGFPSQPILYPNNHSNNFPMNVPSNMSTVASSNYMPPMPQPNGFSTLGQNAIPFTMYSTGNMMPTSQPPMIQPSNPQPSQQQTQPYMSVIQNSMNPNYFCNQSPMQVPAQRTCAPLPPQAMAALQAPPPEIPSQTISQAAMQTQIPEQSLPQQVPQTPEKQYPAQATHTPSTTASTATMTMQSGSSPSSSDRTQENQSHSPEAAPGAEAIPLHHNPIHDSGPQNSWPENAMPIHNMLPPHPITPLAPPHSIPMPSTPGKENFRIPKRKHPSPNLLIDIAETAEESFPYDEVASRHPGASPHQVFEQLSAVLSIPLLRSATGDRMMISRLAAERVKTWERMKSEYYQAKQNQNNASGQEHEGGGSGGDDSQEVQGQEKQKQAQCPGGSPAVLGSLTTVEMTQIGNENDHGDETLQNQNAGRAESILREQNHHQSQVQDGQHRDETRGSEQAAGFSTCRFAVSGEQTE
ncbi:hypothetical protein QBC35DRAFT_149733 [Podospora australis]|uniref:Uncharacterized protein n=1 Tax=Podospora australis TaxID=1536484 RepID=A0AAN6WW57_9PEZI|nr:hypothetical protein QBC35DRAFT_149733 [Podospora australis]